MKHGCRRSLLTQIVRIDLQQFAHACGYIDQLLRAGFATPAATHGPLLHGHVEQRSHAGLVVIGQSPFATGLLQGGIESLGIVIVHDRRVLPGRRRITVTASQTLQVLDKHEGITGLQSPIQSSVFMPM